jgi:uncharacterized membrane protein YccC
MPAADHTLVRTARAALRVERAQISIVNGLRNAAVVALPLAGGIAIGRVVEGVAVAGGALLAAFADVGGPGRIRAVTMLAGAAAGAVSSWLGMVAGPGAAMVTALTAAWGFAGGMLVALGRAATVGLLSTVGLIVAADYHSGPLPALRHSLLALAGGALQAALALVLAPGAGRAPRAALANACRALAEGVADPRASAFPAAQREAETVVTSLSGTQEPPPLLRVARGGLDELDRCYVELSAIAELRTHLDRTSPASAELDAIGRAVAEILAACADGLERRRSPAVPPASAQRLRQASARLSHRPEGAPESVLAARVEAVRGQLRALMDIAGVAAGERASFTAGVARSLIPRPREALEVLRANLDLGSPVLRHALRLAVVLAVATAISRISSFGRGYWIPITALFVLKPDFGQTLTRGLQRYAGTALGVVVSTLLARWLAPGAYGLAALVFAFGWLAFALFRANYAAFSASITAVIVFFVSFGQIAPSQAAIDRFLDSLVGASLALLAYLAWPTWERHRTNAALADLVEADRAYVAGVLAALNGAGRPDPDSVTRLRYAARRRRTIAQASLDRARAEPARAQPDLERAAGVLAATFRLAAAALALEAHTRNAPAGEPLAPLKALTAALDEALHVTAAALRGGTPPPPLPPLRALHDRLAEHPGADTFLAAELDRIVDAVDTVGFLAARSR